MSAQPSASSSASTSSSFLSRTVYNSLPGRFGRAALQSVKNTTFMPFYLSPWGDGSPVEVPNVRKRDIALFPLITPWEVGDQVLGISAKKADTYLSDVIELSGDESMLQGLGHHFLAKLPGPPLSCVQEGVPSNLTDAQRASRLVEQLIPSPQDVAASGSVCTLRVRIRHRFVDEVAQLRFHGESQDRSWSSPFGTSKGWFAPYFHATNRSPYIPRSKTPLMVVCDGPPLHRDGDFALAADLINTSPWVLDFCKPSTTLPTAPPTPSTLTSPVYPISPITPTTPQGPPEYPPDVLPNASWTFHSPTQRPASSIGIQPPAPLIGWSSSRRPSECLMDFSLPNATPCILLPAQASSPLIAYDAHCLSDILSATSNSYTLSEDAQTEYLWQYLRLVVNTDPATGGVASDRMDTYVKRAVRCLVGCVRKVGGVMGKSRIADRAGIVVMKVRADLVAELDPEVLLGSTTAGASTVTLGNGVPIPGTSAAAANGGASANGAGSATVTAPGSPTFSTLSRTWSRESVRTGRSRQ
ncbi:hypothetical protein DL93DRAFT_2162844 [Clavulina sp. PMI_390]|nr:hypothetical protein DL93DRAFT_2162844 [Clavulina sp. PMI_390]